MDSDRIHRKEARHYGDESSLTKMAKQRPFKGGRDIAFENSSPQAKDDNSYPISISQDD